MKDMRQLLNLMENVMAVPGMGQVGGSESDMQTAGTVGRNASYAEFDSAQGQATEESASGSDVAEYTTRLQALIAKKWADRAQGISFNDSEREYSIGYDQLLRDMPQAHNEYVAAQNSKLWAGNDWKRDDKSARSAVAEEAPPGMEDVVMSLKKEYPDDHSKAFATAWSIYNKKHGKANESVPAVLSCQQTNPASADVACAMEESRMTDYDLDFIRQSLNRNYELATSEDELKRMVAGETGYGNNPEFDNAFASMLDHFLNGDDTSFDHMGPDDFSDDADALASAGHGSDEDYGDFPMDEDIQNGYNDVEAASGIDFFPNGADSPVVSNVGPSGARQGDNPEQKKMQVAETHKELVYAYRKFLSESANTAK